MSNLAYQSYMSVSLSPKNRIQQSFMKENYHRKPIFKRNDDKLNSRISIRDSMIICEHQGDTLSNKQSQKVTFSNLQDMHNIDQLPIKISKKVGVFSKARTHRKKQNIRNLMTIKMPNYNRIFGTQKKSPPKNQRRYFSVQKKSKAKQQIDIDQFQIENQILKDQQFLLTQIVLSNQRRLRQLEQLQKHQMLNVDYKRKIYRAKVTIQAWHSNSPNNPILKQLLNVLTF